MRNEGANMIQKMNKYKYIKYYWWHDSKTELNKIHGEVWI